MKLTELVIDSSKTVGKKLILTEVRPVYEYKDGTRTDNITGYRYEVVLTEKAFEKLQIKIDGKNSITMDVGTFPEVTFESLELYLYWTTEGYKVGAKASNITIVRNNK
ncbi:hypothetical protein M2454_002646 [Aequitasia blattaphilus]|uniref:Uncharacterized protein n=1 Tax=Aequitasia blattaphilus TaxID=2949332 RepID=A0ABT1EBN4_9FIRM|nr:hypothetical protein [Aequitasia blattaphilus]MCP1103246.1 hypothetical protein [Aequitasia blattaphilus]MCR8615886.1 hypothetical protein [Aequitasia blattaphilus]